MPPPAEDGACASTADAPDHDVTTVTDAALTEDAAHDPSSTRHAGAADGLGGPRDRASGGYGPGMPMKSAAAASSRMRNDMFGNGTADPTDDSLITY